MKALRMAFLAAMASSPLLAGPAIADDASKLTILFAPASATVDAQGQATLEKASRLYRAGNPIVMIVAGSTDTTGSPAGNLSLSERRARSVLEGLVEHGIPVARLQLLAAGSTDLAVKTGPQTPDPQNRRVDITWR